MTGILSLIRFELGQNWVCKTSKSWLYRSRALFLELCYSPSTKLGLIDKLLLEHVGLPHVLDLAVHRVNFFGCMSQGSHSEPLLLLALFNQSTPSCLKVRGGGGGVGGPCDYCVSPSPFDLDFGTFDFGTSDSGLTI